MRHPFYKAALLLALSWPGSVCAQRWPDPYTSKGTLGLLLEDAFTQALRDCGVNGVFNHRLGSDVRKTSVPTLVRNDLGSVKLNAHVAEQGINSAARIFAYVFPTEADAKALNIVDVARLLPVDVTQ